MEVTPEKLNGLPVMLVEDQQAWAAWLDKNHAVASGLWLRLAKKGANLRSLSYAEALEIALCYGWIDGQKKPYDEASWLQKFTPRGAKSIWSKINREKAQALIRSGHMQPAGFAAIERAKQDGRWETAYDSSASATIPHDFQSALDQNPQAKAFFDTLDRRNRYAILFRIQTAKKAETRSKRIQEFVALLESHQKLYP